MPEIKEKWEEAFEEYCSTLISLGATIKNKKALKMAYKIYREKMPERIYKNCVDESSAQPTPKEEKAPQKEASQPPKEEKNSEKKEKPKSLNSLDALGSLKNSILSEENTEEKTNKEAKTETKKTTTTPTEPKKEEKEAPTPAPKEKETKDTEPKKRPTQKERFAEYKARLEAKGITIKDEQGLWETFRTIRGRLDYKQISEFVIFPERKKEKKKTEKDNSQAEEKKPENRATIPPKSQGLKKEDKKEDTKSRSRSAQKSFDEYRESLLAKGYEITDVGTLARLFVAGKGFVEPEKLAKLVRKVPEKEAVQATISNTLVLNEKDKTMPVVIERSFADKWLKPLQEHCQKDVDKDGQPKRNVRLVQADKNSAVIDVVPTPKHTEQNSKDEGVRYSLKKLDNKGNVDINMGSKNGEALDYEYFRMMMEANRKNGIKVIAFNNIKTEDFRDKLLAAALEFDMKVKGAPQKININAPHLKNLPNKVKIKLGIYNGDIKPTKTAEEIKETLHKGKKAEKPEKKHHSPKQPLALPAHLPSKEMG